MSDGFAGLTEKEKQTLRLIARGHDAKSTARHLGVSVHTVNERLRFARRKLEVTSSREAARFLLDREENAPEIVGHKLLGEAAPAGPVAVTKPSQDGGQASRSTPIIVGIASMSLLAAAVALFTAPQQTPQQARPDTGAAAVAPDAAIVGAARDFLLLMDDGRWAESFDAAGSQFRKANTVAGWASASGQARVPLGAALSRELLSQDYVPAPPRGYAVVKFRTSFANKRGAIETVTLEREGSAWRMAGIVID